MTKQAVATKPDRPIDHFRKQLELAMPTIMHLVPENMSKQQLSASVVLAVANNMKLLECTPQSQVKAAAEAFELGLSLNPSLKEADILPVWNNRISKLEAQMRPRVKGYMKLAMQSGEVKKIEAHIRYTNDTFKRRHGTDPVINHEPADGQRGDKVGVYCVWWLKNGERQFEYMDAEDVLRIKDRTTSKKQDGTIVGPWATDEDEMWRKTVIRRASKYMPLSTESFQILAKNEDEHEGSVVISDEFEGPVVDVTESEPAATKPAETQTNKLAEKIAKTTTKIDHLSALTPLTQLERNVYAKTHAKELTAIEMSEPTVYKQIAELLRGDE